MRRYRLVLRRLEGDGRPLTLKEDWPAVGAPTPAAWLEVMRDLRELNGELRRAVLSFDPERLDEALVPQPPYSAYTQFIGMTQHDLYHAGQIVLLKRAMRKTA